MNCPGSWQTLKTIASSRSMLGTAWYGKEQHLSHQHFYGYHDGARAAMLAFASPVVKSLPYERAKRLVDLHKLDDITKSRQAVWWSR